MGRKPSTAMLRVALGMRTTKPSSSLQATIWQPSRDLQQGGRVGGGPGPEAWAHREKRQCGRGERAQRISRKGDGAVPRVGMPLRRKTLLGGGVRGESKKREGK